MQEPFENNDPINKDLLDEYLKRAAEPDSPLSDEGDTVSDKSTSEIHVTEPAESLVYAKKLPKNEEEKSEKQPKRKRRGLYTLIGVLVLIIGFSIGYARFKSSNTSRILVEGNYYTSNEDILKKASIPSDVSPDSVDLYAVINRIEQLPFIKRADIAIIPPSQLKITIEERKPIALLLQGTAKALVDEDGLVMPQLHDKTPHVPLLYGFPVNRVNDTLKTKAFKQTARFLSALQNHPVGNATVSEVAWSDKDGVVAMSTENGVKLIFGTEDPAETLESWEAFYAQIVPKVGIDNLAEVDLRYKGQVITR
ncbi:FtsQ-type POTRA domain-containing protein [bacterium]|nr:MAG: FtsQ-type POTRA domain-containing protein [bacterium]